MKKHSDIMIFVGINLAHSLTERIKAKARHRSVIEGRHVPYCELVRACLEREFPVIEPVQTTSQN